MSCPAGGMYNEFTTVVERDGGWFVAWCPEIPGANGAHRRPEPCASCSAHHQT